jgi:putative ABC transport system ATP-binding protein
MPVPALTSVDVVIGRGDFLVLEGPSGSGKTTLINLLGLLDRSDEGRLFVDGRPVEEMDEDERSDLRRDKFGFVFQTFNLIPVLSARENVEFPMVLKGLDRDLRRRRSLDLLSRVGLTSKEAVRPDLLSGGERQRVSIARSLVNEPEVVLADEPTANLDTKTADGILDLMRALNLERGVAFVVATHDPRVVARSSRVITLRDGRIVSEA